jgi:cyclopropane fatty-acyl-phospholipid synthase-like methyltransferase
MPSDDLLLYFQRDLAIVDHWIVNGKEYERTCNAWLAEMDANRPAALAAIESCYGAKDRCVADA